MDCQFLEKISLLIDGELPSDEIESVKTHLTNCEDCRAAERDFLFFRQSIKHTLPQLASIDGRSRKDTGNKINRFPLIERFSLSAPVIGVLILMLAVVGGWLILPEFHSRSRTASRSSGQQSSVIEISQPRIPSTSSLARFDRGGRAEIYVVRNQPATEADK